MKKILILILTIILNTNFIAQTDRHGNPIFISEQLSEENIDVFELTSSYYTITNNISNKESSVYVSDTPSLEEYIKFSRDLPSYFFIIHKGQNVFVMIMPIQQNDGSDTRLKYNIINPNNGQSIEVPCSVFGEISEMRAHELIKLNIDSESKIIDLPNNGKGLVFNKVVYRIQPYDQLKHEVIEIAKQLTSDVEDIKDLETYIKKETIGGQLDFNKALENEQQSFFLYDGVAYSKKEFAIYLWGKKVKMLGIDSSKKAVKLWEEINQRNLTSSEKKALMAGFDSKDK